MGPVAVGGFEGRRVLLIAEPSRHGEIGGAALHVAELERALRSQGAVVRRLSDPKADREPHPLPGGRLLRSMGAPGALAALLATVRDFAPDLVHIHSLRGLPPEIVARLRALSVRVVWSHHDAFAICPRVHLHDGELRACDGPGSGLRCGPCHGGVQGVVGAPAFLWRRRRFLRALRACGEHLLPSRWLVQAFLAAGVRPETMRVVPPALPRPEPLALLPNTEGPPRVLIVGEWRPEKGVDRAVAFLGALEQRSPGLRVELWGGPPEGEHTPWSRALLSRVPSGVTVIGRYSPEALGPALDGAAAVVLAPRVRESFGRVANEALLRGAPVVVPAGDGLAEQVTDGVDGVVVAADGAAAWVEAVVRAVSLGNASPLGEERRARRAELPDLDGVLRVLRG